ncbi:MAG: RsmE family RNA methyltransferase [Chitinophagaceae bacterium]
MALPFFYIKNYEKAQKEIVLDEDSSKHIVQVLRMKEGELLNLTDGKGNLITCTIKEEDKKNCIVTVKDCIHKPQNITKVTIAISLLKNSNRFEWFLEKVTEIGACKIIPLICKRTEKTKFRYNRMESICISAMLQSQQVWLPLLQQPLKFENLVTEKFNHWQKFIAHCAEGENQKKQLLAHSQLSKSAEQLIVIGPEGDFTPEEIDLALTNEFIAVSLGETRLRTETAGVAAATILVMGN